MNLFFQNNYGWFIKEVYYTRKFAIIILEQKTVYMKLIPWDKQLIDWKNFKRRCLNGKDNIKM